MASPNFRLKKIANVVGKFRVRRAILKNQLDHPEFQSETTKEFIQGQIAALDLVIQDLFMEFDIEHPDRIDEPKRKREIIERMVQDGHVKEGQSLLSGEIQINVVGIGIVGFAKNILILLRKK